MDEQTPESAETDRLLRMAEGGDRGAFEELFGAHRAFLRQFTELRLDARLRARVDPSDVVQETQLEAYRRLTDFLARRPMPFRLWLRQTAQECLSKARRRHLDTARRSVGREMPLPDRSSLALADQLRAGGSSPSERLSRREVVGRVNDAVAGLPEGDRELLLLRNFEGLSYQEIGYLLGIEEAAARKRFGRALLRLRKLLIDGGLLEPDP
jgi:RNA polymerase sigma-70 factor (ECF subfamily)